MSENGDTPMIPPPLSHEEQIDVLVTRMETDPLYRDRVLAETYLLAHRTAQFSDEFRTVMQTMTSGKMGGLMGRLMGRQNADAETG